MPPAPRGNVMIAGKSVPAGGAMMQNLLATPRIAPPPIGSGADNGSGQTSNPLAPAVNALAPAPAAQQAPVAAVPSQPPSALPPGPPPPPASADSPDQHLAVLGQQLDAANLTPEMVDQHAASYGAAVHHLGALVQKGASVTHDDVVRQAMYAVQGGSIAPDVAARFVESVKGSPQQLQAKLQQAVANTMLTNVALAALKQRMSGAAPSNNQPQMNQPKGNQS